MWLHCQRKQEHKIVLGQIDPLAHFPEPGIYLSILPCHCHCRPNHKKCSRRCHKHTIQVVIAPGLQKHKCQTDQKSRESWLKRQPFLRLSKPQPQGHKKSTVKYTVAHGNKILMIQLKKGIKRRSPQKLPVRYKTVNAEQQTSHP